MLESGQEFELLFSDVVMPNGMNGIELAREARRLGKGIKILLTSGYAGDVSERHQAVDEFPIIDKPYGLADLARRLRSRRIAAITDASSATRTRDNRS
jgi:CheY-like chemotaxis protein